MRVHWVTYANWKKTEKSKLIFFLLKAKYDYVSSAGEGDLAVEFGHMDIDPDNTLDNEGHPRWNQAKAEEIYSLIVYHNTWVVVRCSSEREA